MTEIYSSRFMLGDDVNAVYKLLRFLPIEHCVDVGAASGGTTGLMKRYAPDCTVDAFEPFPGNIPLFKQSTSDLTGVRLRQAAVTVKPGRSALRVAPSVSGNEPGWEDRIGYSSGSRLATGAKSENTIEVECESIDEAVRGRISFLKIDVQGTERDVLESASNHFDKREVDFCFVEFNGEDSILEFFEKYSFHLFYTPFLLAGKDTVANQSPNLQVVQQKKMSNGYLGECVWDSETPSGARAFASHLRSMAKNLKRTVQTDLVCVSSEYLAVFLRAVADLKDSTR
ncbi:MAG: FkbM family methyltransferase [Pseudomonadota bacterium]